MNAPIADQIKAEAAKSLLERMAEKTKLVRFFRYNASAKHGVPIDSDGDAPIKFDEPPKPEPQPQQPAGPTTIVQPVIIDKSDSSTETTKEKENSSWTKGILQTLVAIAALVAAAWGGSKLMPTDQGQAPNTTIVQPYQESPIQYLEDLGEHLP